MNNETTKTDSGKQSLNRLAMKAGIFYIIAQVMVRGITFLTTPIYSRLLSPAQYSDIRIYESWLLIAVPTFSLCLWKSVDRAKYDFKEKYNEYVSSVQTLSFFSILFFTGVCFIFKDAVKQFCHLDDLMFYMAFAYILAYTSILYFQRREKQLMRYKASTFVTAITVIPATVLSILLIAFGREKGWFDALVDLRVIGFYTPHVLIGVIIAILLCVQGRKIFSAKYWRYGLLYSIPLIPEAISIQIMNQADKIMVQKLISSETAALIAMGTTISFIIWILEDSVWNAWLPWLFEKFSRNETKDIERPWTSIMHCFGVISWILVMLSPEIVAVLGGSRYHATIYLTAPMVTGTLFRFFSYSYTAAENYHKKTSYVAGATVATMILNVILNYVCILRFGYIAAAYTTAFSYFMLMIVQGFLEFRITGTLIIPIQKSVIISISYFLLCCFSMGLFPLPIWIRYIVLVIGCAIAAKLLLPRCLSVLKTLKKK